MIFKWPIFLWAFVISFAQVYVGIHFPLDIFFGALLGILIGALNAYLFSIAEEYFRSRTVLKA